MEVYGGPERRISLLAGAQNGVVARSQMLSAGLTDPMIKSRVRSGYLTPMTRGIYAVGHLALPPLAAETAALLARPPGALLSHLSAASLWRIHEARDPLVDVLVGGTGGRRRPGIREHRTLLRARMERRYVRGLPVTAAAQTLADLAPVLTPRELERALDEALARRLTHRVEVARALHGRANGRGVGALRRLVEERGPLSVTRSEAEERLLALIREAQLPEPEMNVRLHGFTVDFLWRQAGLVVEVDGYQWHSTRSAFERDRRKDLALRESGLDLARFTFQQIDTQPVAVVAAITRRLHKILIPV